MKKLPCSLLAFVLLTSVSYSQTTIVFNLGGQNVSAGISPTNSALDGLDITKIVANSAVATGTGYYYQTPNTTGNSDNYMSFTVGLGSNTALDFSSSTFSLGVWGNTPTGRSIDVDLLINGAAVGGTQNYTVGSDASTISFNLSAAGSITQDAVFRVIFSTGNSTEEVGIDSGLAGTINPQISNIGVSAVPEPGHYALLLGVVSISSVLVRRKGRRLR